MTHWHTPSQWRKVPTGWSQYHFDTSVKKYCPFIYQTPDIRTKTHILLYFSSFVIILKSQILHIFSPKICFTTICVISIQMWKIGVILYESLTLREPRHDLSSKFSNYIFRFLISRIVNLSILDALSKFESQIKLQARYRD